MLLDRRYFKLCGLIEIRNHKIHLILKQAIRRSSMKAVRIHQYGDRDVMQLEDVPVPQILDDEVLIKVVATSINPVDWKVRKGDLKEMITCHLPLILGWDVAGVVEKIGKCVKGFKVGDGVYSRPELTRDGTYAEYIAVKENEIASKPETISFMEAASLPLAGIAAYESVIQNGKIKRGQSILIHAAAGGVGSISVQLAKWRGARVIATASAENHDFVKSLGADRVIDYQSIAFKDVVRDVDVVFDTIGGQVQEDSWSVLKSDGILVSIVQPPSEKCANKFEAEGRFVFIQPNASILKELAILVDDGILRPIVGAEFALKDVAKAHELSESGHMRGKIVIHVGTP
jgi:NADPH:quinone reductase-like Zn-dependent oxidoreductase